jgi:hypothetical protein
MYMRKVSNNKVGEKIPSHNIPKNTLFDVSNVKF